MISRAPASARSPRSMALSDTATADGIAFTTDEILAFGSYETLIYKRDAHRHVEGGRGRGTSRDV